ASPPARSVRLPCNVRAWLSPRDRFLAPSASTPEIGRRSKKLDPRVSGGMVSSTLLVERATRNFDLVVPITRHSRVALQLQIESTVFIYQEEQCAEQGTIRFGSRRHDRRVVARLATRAVGGRAGRC